MTSATQPSAPIEPADAAASGADTPSLSAGHAGRTSRQPELTIEVGHLTQQELDEHIASLGRLMVRAHRLGDPGTARKLLEMQAAARDERKTRFPEHQAHLEADHLRMVEEGVGFFSSDAAVAMGRSGGGA